jgi:hypothetical protein
MATSMKMKSFWDVASCTFVVVDLLIHNPNDGGSTHL